MPADLTVDILCAGSGAGGSAAALAAAECGLEPLIVEKSPLIGGGTAYSGGGLWVGANHLAAELGIADSLEAADQYMRFVGGGFEEPANRRGFVEWAPRALLGFQQMGVEFRLLGDYPDHHFPTAPGSVAAGRTLEVAPVPQQDLGLWGDRMVESPYFPRGVAWSDVVRWGGPASRRVWPKAELESAQRRETFAGGQGLVAQLMRAALSRGIRIRTETSLVRLIQADGRVTGAVVSEHGQEQRIHARAGVVLASGGYESNTTLARRYEGLPDFVSLYPETNQGDGLVAGAELGAMVSRTPLNLMMSLGYLIPGASSDERGQFRNTPLQALGFPHTMVVNRQGVRFADESRFQRMVPFIRQFDVDNHVYANLPCFLIFDAQFVAKYPIADREPGEPMPDWVPRGESLSELADKLGIAAAGLQATVDAFNPHAERGEDPVFGRGSSAWSRRSAGDATHQPNPNLGPISCPPYYGLRLHPTSQPSAGLLTNERGQVMHVRGTPIPGLYACGNAMAQSHYGCGYQLGLQLMGALTFGYRAALDAAEHAAGRG